MKSIRSLTTLVVILLASVLFYACDKDDDNNQDVPATIELTGVDYITQSEATVMADIVGYMPDVDQKGICWSKNSSPTVDDEAVFLDPQRGIFSVNLSDLQADQTYYVRAFYVSETTVHYSDQKSFTTPSMVQDAEGNSYSTVQIGNQIWFAQNLSTRLYSNGDSIESGIGMGNIVHISSPRYYFEYGDHSHHVETYGRLYTWYVVSDPREVCPSGWRVPDILDWQDLAFHVDALARSFDELSDGDPTLSAIAGGMIRTTGTQENQTGLWKSPNNGATNQTRMSVLPSGYRDPSGGFDALGVSAAFWSFTDQSIDEGIMFYTHYFNPGFYANYFHKNSGYAVRCVKDANP